MKKCKFVDYRDGKLFPLVEGLAEELGDELDDPVVSQEGVEPVAERRLRLELFVLDLQLAQGQDSRHQVRPDSLVSEELFEVVGRGFVVDRETLLEIFDDQADVGRFRQQSVRQVAVETKKDCLNWSKSCFNKLIFPSKILKVSFG